MWAGGYPLGYLAKARRQPHHRHRRPRPTWTWHSVTPDPWQGIHPAATARGDGATGIGELGGMTTMMPSEDAEWVAADLTRRFGLPLLVVHP
jgi:glutamate-1-semialdehyde 2,1-aminomutase